MGRRVQSVSVIKTDKMKLFWGLLVLFFRECFFNGKSPYQASGTLDYPMACFLACPEPFPSDNQPPQHRHLCLFPTDIVASDLQQFDTIPRSQFVPDGQPVLLECQISGQQQDDTLFEYSWTRNGAEKESLSAHNNKFILTLASFPHPPGTTIVHRKMVSATTPMDLFIQEFQAGRDSGVYVCTVTDSSTGARLATPAASLNVLSKLHLTECRPVNNHHSSKSTKQH